MSISKEVFGKTPKGEDVYIFQINNKNGCFIEVINYGAIVVRVVVPDREGNLTDVVLGYDTLEGYLDNKCYFGATLGRNANRISNAAYTLNGKEYHLTENDNHNNLHSGPNGFENRIWEVLESSQDENSIALGLHSPDMEQGYPGNLDVQVKYELSDYDELIIHYTGKADQDTILNLTNHTYYNLSGHDSGNVLTQMINLWGSTYTPCDEDSVPTGEIARVKGTPMDFTEPKPIGREIDENFEQLRFAGGYDHNYIVDDYEPDVMQFAARAYSPRTGISMDVITDRPGVQFYAGNYIDNEVGKNGCIYGKRSGFCLETQYFPDAINKMLFESPILKAQEEYNSVTIYKFGLM